MNLKWGRRNSPPPSSFVSRPSLFSSWLSKFKKMVTSDPVPEPEAKPEHGGFDGKKKSRGVEGPMSSFRSSRSNGVREESWKFSIKVKELTQEKKEKDIKTPRKGSMKHVLEVGPEKTVQHCYNNNLKTNEEDHIHATSDFLHTNEVSGQKLKDVKLKTEKRRKSYYISRELEGRRTKQFSKVRVRSPRPPAKLDIRKVQALQDLKRTRLKKKEKTRKATSLESLAVVKCSFDPEKDFRESMMEMIFEESINKPEDLEELLACYLTLNADECHDLIIKVFRQVWLDMNKTCSQAEIHGEDGSYV